MGSLKILLNELNQCQTEPVRLKMDALSQMDWRTIRRLYTERGLDQVVVRVSALWYVSNVKMLVEAPKTTIPRLIQRMEEKEDIWIREKSLLETVSDFDYALIHRNGENYKSQIMLSLLIHTVIHSRLRINEILTWKHLLIVFVYHSHSLSYWIVTDTW